MIQIIIVCYLLHCFSLIHLLNLPKFEAFLACPSGRVYQIGWVRWQQTTSRATKSDIRDIWCACFACTPIEVHTLIMNLTSTIWWYLSYSAHLWRSHFRKVMAFFFPFRWWIERGRSHCTGKTSSSKSIGFIDGSCKVTLRLGICQTCGENVKQPEGVHLAPAGGFLFDKMWKKRDWMISLWSI